MPKTAPYFDVAFAPRTKGATIYRWLYDELRRAMLDGRLGAGKQLPSSRALAQQYGVARGTVVAVFEQLAAEGYVETRVGAGSFVRSSLPDRFLRSEAPTRSAARETSGAALSARGKRLAQSPFPVGESKPSASAFRTDFPALDVFPTALWSRIAARRLRRATRPLLLSGEALGYRPLREAIAAYLGPARGIACAADEVVITSGTQQSLDLVARLVLDEGDRVWVEDPGYPGAVALLRGLGAEVCPVPVDADGIDCAEGKRRAEMAKLAYVTPAHQFPLGVALSAARRLELLRWARGANSWIFEDDYDGEYRFAGRPLAALRSLDQSGCVIYAGSFSKTLFPTLRLGYLVVPIRLAAPLAAARSLIDRYPPVLEQAVLADFIAEGHFGRHVRRMRELYARKLEVLRTAVDDELEGLLDLVETRAGLQTVGWLARSIRDQEAERAAAEVGLDVAALSWFALERKVRPGLMLGFAMADERTLRQGVTKLATVLRKLKRTRAPTCSER